MKRIVWALIGMLLILGVSGKDCDILKNTPQLNFTFYFDHEYPPPDCSHIYLFAWEEGASLQPMLQNISNSMASVKAVAANFNASVDDFLEGNLETNVEWTDKFTIQREIMVELKDKLLLPELMDALNELRH